MSRLSCVLMAVLLLLPSVPAAEIFKCTDSNGTIKLQNFPCNIDTIGSTATAPAPDGAAPATAPSAANAQNVPGARGQQVSPGQNAVVNQPQAAVSKPEPRIGMTRRQV